MPAEIFWTVDSTVSNPCKIWSDGFQLVSAINNDGEGLIGCQISTEYPILTSNSDSEPYESP